MWALKYQSLHSGNCKLLAIFSRQACDIHYSDVKHDWPNVKNEYLVG